MPSNSWFLSSSSLLSFPFSDLPFIIYVLFCDLLYTLFTAPSSGSRKHLIFTHDSSAQVISCSTEAAPQLYEFGFFTARKQRQSTSSPSSPFFSFVPRPFVGSEAAQQVQDLSFRPPPPSFSPVLVTPETDLPKTFFYSLHLRCLYPRFTLFCSIFQSHCFWTRTYFSRVNPRNKYTSTILFIACHQPASAEGSIDTSVGLLCPPCKIFAGLAYDAPYNFFLEPPWWTKLRWDESPSAPNFSCLCLATAFSLRLSSTSFCTPIF